MNRALALVVAGTLSLPPIFAFADDQTPSGYTKEVQEKEKKQADAKKAATAKMTPERKAAAKKARQAKAQKDQDTIDKMTQNPGDARNMSINKSAETSKAGPTPQRDYLNTPEAEQKLMKQHGQ